MKSYALQYIESCHNLAILLCPWTGQCLPSAWGT